MTNVARCTPQNFLPYIDFSIQVPYASATAWSASASRVKLERVLAGELRDLVDLSGEIAEHAGAGRLRTRRSGRERCTPAWCSRGCSRAGRSRGRPSALRSPTSVTSSPCWSGREKSGALSPSASIGPEASPRARSPGVVVEPASGLARLDRADHHLRLLGPVVVDRAEGLGGDAHGRVGPDLDDLVAELEQQPAADHEVDLLLVGVAVAVGALAAGARRASSAR